MHENHLSDASLALGAILTFFGTENVDLVQKIDLPSPTPHFGWARSLWDLAGASRGVFINEMGVIHHIPDHGNIPPGPKQMLNLALFAEVSLEPAAAMGGPLRPSECLPLLGEVP